ncbi:MAG: methyltransferase domain-containing protein [Patescibacteria group bacterium]
MIGKSRIYLNFGAGNPVPGWVNMDSSPFFFFPRFIHQILNTLKISSRSQFFLNSDYQYYYYSVHKKLPFSDESVTAVYISHVLEHLSVEEVSELLKEFRRILSKNGVVRVLVPDLEKSFNTALSKPTAYVSLEEKLLTLPKELKSNKVRAMLEAYFGFPSFHKTIFIKRKIKTYFSKNWQVSLNLKYLDSKINKSVLQKVEMEVRTRNAVVFELIKK